MRGPLHYLRSLRIRTDDEARPLPYTDPLQAGRHPFQTYLLALCFISGLPYFFGQATAEAVENRLPVYVALAWGVLLVVGSALALVGSHWRGGYDTALTMERAGLYITGVDGLVYGLCILGGRDPFGGFLGLGLLVGATLVFAPVPVCDPRKKMRVEDSMAILGVALSVISAVLLTMSPAITVLVGAFVVTGFGLSCLRRARDIALIFDRARAPEPPPILREGEDE